MASRATRNTLATLALTEGYAEMVLAEKPNMIVKKHLENMKTATRAAFDALKTSCSQRDIDRISARTEELTKAGFTGRQEVTTMTSFMLELLEKLQAHFKPNSAKWLAIEKIIASVSALHNYFDHELKQTARYEEAGHYAEVWENTAE